MVWSRKKIFMLRIVAKTSIWSQEDMPAISVFKVKLSVIGIVNSQPYNKPQQSFITETFWKVYIGILNINKCWWWIARVGEMIINLFSYKASSYFIINIIINFKIDLKIIRLESSKSYLVNSGNFPHHTNYPTWKYPQALSSLLSTL